MDINQRDLLVVGLAGATARGGAGAAAEGLAARQRGVLVCF